MPRKKSDVAVRNVHVQIELTLCEKARRRAKRRGLTMRNAIERGLRLFIEESRDKKLAS